MPLFFADMKSTFYENRRKRWKPLRRRCLKPGRPMDTVVWHVIYRSSVERGVRMKVAGHD